MSPKLYRPSVLGTLLAGVALVACNGGGSGSTGLEGPGVADVRVSASSELPTEMVSSAKFAITSIDLVPVGSATSVVSLFLGRQTIDVIPLSNGGSIALLGTGVPAGVYGQARVSISGPATIQLADGRTFASGPAGGATVTIPLEPPLAVAAGAPRVMLLLVDLASSFPIVPSFSLATAQVTGVGFSPVLRAMSGPASAGGLNGTVYSTSGEPVAGASVKIKQSDLVYAAATTGSDGGFALSLPDGGSWVIEAGAAGFASTRAPSEGAAADGVAFASVRLNPACGCEGCGCGGYRGCGCGCGSRPKDNTGTIQGTVADATSGAPIAGASVRAVANGVVAGTATTAADGTFSVPGLVTGSYDVTVAADRFSSSTVPGQHVNPHDATTVVVRLDASR